mmetsp:Transcript_3611/g.8254  ORF Transcript_3611/g.8254 Transcript_3611/m.8254 type:complete len:436 (+) Transcript_3611:370-1677(+)
MSVTEDQVRLQRVLVQSGFHHTSIQGNMTEHNEENNPAFDYKQVPIFGIPWRHDEDDCHVLVKESHDKYAIRKLKCLRVKEHQVRAVDPHFGGYHLERLPKKGAPKWLALLSRTVTTVDSWTFHYLPTHAICRSTRQEGATSSPDDFSSAILEVPRNMIKELNWSASMEYGVSGWIPGADLQPWLPAEKRRTRMEKLATEGMCLLYSTFWGNCMIFGVILIFFPSKTPGAVVLSLGIPTMLWHFIVLRWSKSYDSVRKRIFENLVVGSSDAEYASRYVETVTFGTTSTKLPIRAFLYPRCRNKTTSIGLVKNIGVFGVLETPRDCTNRTAMGPMSLDWDKGRTPFVMISQEESGLDDDLLKRMPLNSLVAKWKHRSMLPKGEMEEIGSIKIDSTVRSSPIRVFRVKNAGEKAATRLVDEENSGINEEELVCFGGH